MLAKLSDGFEIEIDENCLDDWEMLDALNEIDKGSSGKIVDVAKMMLGEDGVGKLKEHFRSEGGKVSVTVMVSAITELMESVSTLKNS